MELIQSDSEAGIDQQTQSKESINSVRNFRTPSVFEQFRYLLSALQDESKIFPALRAAGYFRGWWNPDRTWKCIYSSFEPFSEKIFTLLYETIDEPQRICRLEIFARPGMTTHQKEFNYYHDVLGWLRLAHFQWDSKLKTLPVVLRKGEKYHVLRYWPYRECVIQFPQGKNTFSIVAKVYPDEQGKNVFKSHVDIWQTAQNGEFDFFVGRPILWDHDTYTFWLEEVWGEWIGSRLWKEDGAELAFKMGQALASFSRSTYKPKRILNSLVQMRHSRRYANALYRRIPDLAGLLHKLLYQLRRIHDSQETGQLFPIHGSLHVNRWKIWEGRLGVVDFDRAALGDRERDIANLAVEIESTSLDEFEKVQIIEAFIAGFESRGGLLNRPLLNAYCAHQCLFNALKTAQSAFLDGDQRAEAILSRAIDYVRR